MDDQIQQADEQTFLKVLFLYFFEALGVSRQDQEALRVLWEFTLSEREKRELSQAEYEKVKIDLTKGVLHNYSFGGKQNAQQRTLKRIVKLATQGLVDLYPAKNEYFPRIVKIFKRFSTTKFRAIRLGFTTVSLLVNQALLTQLPPLVQLKSEFKK